MKFSKILIGSLASIASAHFDPRDANAAIPQLVGGRKFMSEMKARNALPQELEASFHIEERHHEAQVLEERQDSNGRCGVGFGANCATGCCSPAGYCGTTEDYCAAPDCQLAYGPGCDGNQVPAGISTSTIARPFIGNVPYGGAGIYDCVVPGDVAFTFDDGPYNYTSDLLDKLKVYNASATFFITGNNLGKGPIDSTLEWSNLINRMIAEGHQVASHTWSHQNLTSLDLTTFHNQIYYNEMAFRNILDYFPTYMRPPYSECNDTCGDILATLGYHVTYFSLDTAGYLNPTAQLIQNSKNIWDATMNTSNPSTDSILEIEHDIVYQSVYNLTDYILASMYSHGFKSVTVGECLGDPAVNWYRSGDPNAVPPPSNPQSISDDGSCSATVTCQGSTYGNCCSQHGYCGSTTDYCGTGCQSGSGTCLSSTTTTKVFSTSSYKSSSTPRLSSIHSTIFSTSTKHISTPSKISSLTASSKTSSSKTPISSKISSSTSSTSNKSTKVSSTSTSTSTHTATATKAVSTDGSCSSNFTCLGSQWGNCCSQYGYCGSTTNYCGTGCNSAFGTCS